MERKVGAGTVAVTREDVKTAVSRAKTLTSEEEKALRMRYGIGAETTSAPLPRAADRNAELDDELLVIEMQLQKAWRMRLAQEKAARNTVAPKVVAQPSRTKEKIARALRKKR